MLNLSQTALEAWYEKLPADVQEAISSDFPTDNDQLTAFASKLAETEPSDLPQFLNESAPQVEELGRIGRIRLLSYISNKVYPYQVKTFHQIVNEDDETGGKGKIQILFIEDLRALNEAVASRIFKNNMDMEAINALKEAAYETEPLPTFS